ncbi:MAG TPA: hypothetical protein DDZ51_15240 [Planctomycetaceae bacterium]|nr:hypothetical protein [Planctomycetaceae bacterium]
MISIIGFKSIIPREVRLRWQRELENWLVICRLPIELAASTVHQKLPNHDCLIKTRSAREQAEFCKGSDRIFHRSLNDCHGASPGAFTTPESFARSLFAAHVSVPALEDS